MAAHSTIKEPRMNARRFTRSEYYSMAELGFFEGENVELLEGEIIPMSPQSGPHALLSKKISHVLEAALGSGYFALNHSPLSLPGNSEPEPDVALIQGKVSDFDDNPTSAELVVEISLSSYAKDRFAKASIYARGGIQDYWIVDLKKNQLEVLRNPEKESGKLYTNSLITILRPGAFVSPLISPRTRIAVADLFPPVKK